VNSFRLVQSLAAHFQRAGGMLLQRTVTGFDVGTDGRAACSPMENRCRSSRWS